MASPNLCFKGLGLHTGSHCQVTIGRAQPGRGITFIRRDLPGARPIPAMVDSVRSSVRQTCLGLPDSNATVATTEHILAALTGLGIWDATIEVVGPEIPILDGSALPFVDALSSWSDQAAPCALSPQEQVIVHSGASKAVASPSPNFSVSCFIEFDHRCIGRQEAMWDGSTGTFRHDLAPARTFGFVGEVDALRRRGLAQGGSLENALVFGSDGPINAPRFVDEPARHKLLDAIGDLALLGRPLRAQVTLERPGHTLVVELVQKLREVSR